MTGRRSFEGVLPNVDLLQRHVEEISEADLRPLQSLHPGIRRARLAGVEGPTSDRACSCGLWLRWAGPVGSTGPASDGAWGGGGAKARWAGLVGRRGHASGWAAKVSRVCLPSCWANR
jgi:hypothetical protein